MSKDQFIDMVVVCRRSLLNTYYWSSLRKVIEVRNLSLTEYINRGIYTAKSNVGNILGPPRLYASDEIMNLLNNIEYASN